MDRKFRSARCRRDQPFGFTAVNVLGIAFGVHTLLALPPLCRGYRLVLNQQKGFANSGVLLLGLDRDSPYLNSAERDHDRVIFAP